jgi:hypothetical protein
MRAMENTDSAAAKQAVVVAAGREPDQQARHGVVFSGISGFDLFVNRPNRFCVGTCFGSGFSLEVSFPVAGTGHEGYGKYGQRGRKASGSSSSGTRTRSTSTSVKFSGISGFDLFVNRPNRFCVGTCFGSGFSLEVSNSHIQLQVGPTLYQPIRCNQEASLKSLRAMGDLLDNRGCFKL